MVKTRIRAFVPAIGKLSVTFWLNFSLIYSHEIYSNLDVSSLFNNPSLILVACCILNVGNPFHWVGQNN